MARPLRFLVVLGALLFATGGAALALDFPALTGRIVDQAGLLNNAFERELTAELAAHEKTTSNQVVVVTLPSLQGVPIEDFGYQLGRHWGIGQKGRDNGVLLIVAPNERKVRIEVGYGLEGTLTDALAKRIIEREILPAFRNGNFPTGIRDGTAAILDVLAGGPWAADHGDDVGLAGIGFIVLWFMVAGFIVYKHIQGNRRRRRARRARGLDDDPIIRDTGRGWGLGSGGFSGGGFSGGGGGFGGGGASGGW